MTRRVKVTVRAGAIVVVDGRPYGEGEEITTTSQEARALAEQGLLAGEYGGRLADHNHPGDAGDAAA